MTLTINGKTDSLESTVSVIELLKIKDVEMPEMVSVQLNGTILERSDFETTIVNEGDEVEFLYFMGGGQPGLTCGGQPGGARNGECNSARGRGSGDVARPTSGRRGDQR